MRAPDGTISTFDVPSEAIQPEGINSKGIVVGYTESQDLGFERHPNGTIRTIRVKGSRGTFAMGINDTNAITGRFVDTNNQIHGFIRMP